MHWCEVQIQIAAPSLHPLAAPRLRADSARAWGGILVQERAKWLWDPGEYRRLRAGGSSSFPPPDANAG